MDINLLKKFVAVAETQNFSKAAELLFTTKQNISYSMKTIEKNLGVTLFTRDGNKISLNRNGQIFYTEILPLYEKAYQLQRNFCDENSDSNLVISSISRNFVHLLMNVMKCSTMRKFKYCEYGLFIGKFAESFENSKLDMLIDFERPDLLSIDGMKRWKIGKETAVMHSFSHKNISDIGLLQFENIVINKIDLDWYLDFCSYNDIETEYSVKSGHDYYTQLACPEYIGIGPYISGSSIPGNMELIKGVKDRELFIWWKDDIDDIASHLIEEFTIL